MRKKLKWEKLYATLCITGDEFAEGVKTMGYSRQNQSDWILVVDDDSEAETRGLKAGAIDFLKKPFVP